MKLKNIYNLAVKEGMKVDPRKPAEIKEVLDRARKECRKAKGVDKRTFDTDRLKNPYSDTRILYGDPDKDVRNVMVGIDMEGPELLLADRLNQSDRRTIDLVIAHHPEGVAWARLYDVMGLQANMLNKLGIPMEVSKKYMKDRSEEVARALAPANHCRSVDIARLLDMPYMCVHTPCDNHVTDYLQKLFNSRKPKKLAHVVSILKSIPEYEDATRKDAGPKILIGDPKKNAGKIFVDMTGGTEGSKKVFARLSQAGVGTIVAMHLSEDHYKCAQDENINVVIAGHIASDTLGINLVLDKLEKSGELNVVPCSGFIRVRR